MREIELIYERFKSDSYVKELLFDNLRKSGKNFKGTCPHCGGNDCEIWSNAATYYCHNCGAKGNWITAIEEKHNCDFVEAVKILCDWIGEDSSFLKSKTYQTATLEREQEKLNKQIILDANRALLSIFKEDLINSQAARDYLSSRGYDPTKAVEAGIGFISKASLSKANAVLEANGLQPLPLMYGDRICIPSQDCENNSSSYYIFRKIDDSNEEPKYIVQPGAKKSLAGLFHVDSRSKNVVVVESILEACWLNYHDENSKNFNWIGLGDATISAERLKALNELITDETLTVTFLLDNDKTGLKNSLITPEKVKLYCDLQERLTVFFWEWDKMCVAGKDLSDLFESGYNYRDLTEDLDNQEYARNLPQQIVFTCFLDYLNLSDYQLLEAQDKYLNLISHATPDIREACKIALEYRFQDEPSVLNSLLNAQEALEKELLDSSYFTQLQEWTKQLDIAAKKKDEKRIDYLEKHKPVRRLQAEKLVEEAPVFSLEYALQQLKGQISDEKFYYPNLDAIAPLTLGAIALFVASTGFGKSSLLVNFLRMQLENSSNNCVFLSLEEQNLYIWRKFVFSISGALIVPEKDKEQNMKALTYHLESGKIDKKIEKAIAQIQQWQEEQRLFLHYKDPLYVHELELLFEEYSKKNIKVLALDYIQKIKVKDASKNYLDAKTVAETLDRLAKAHNICILTAAQINRGPSARQDKRPGIDDIREASDYAHVSSLVAALHSPVNYNPDVDDPDLLEFIMLKNRYGGGISKKIHFKFQRHLCRITETF